MNHDELLAFARNAAKLSDLCLPGLVPAHGQADSLQSRYPALGGKLEVHRQAARLYSGKVRDRIDLGGQVLMFTSDRVSAFDVILGLVPFKGEVLNRVSLFWFENTRDIIDNHVIRPLGGRGLLARKAKVLPVEVVVRGYLTGSAWRDYQAGRPVSGVSFPAGMRKDESFPVPVITPSTKEAVGSHDQPISCAEIVSRGLVPAATWAAVEQAALALFARGTEIAARNGLILVDTKYEFGLVADGPDAGKLILVDEIHTPDSSRFWYADSYQALFQAGQEQRKLDKEYLRGWLMDQGWSGNGTPPAIPDAVYLELAWRYVQAFQEITGQDFRPESANLEADAQKLQSVL
jgi:phosphoribosylaminoimidazole-succinocarboxamide synthase